MFLAETNARRLDDGTLKFQLPGFPRSHYLISPWRHGFTTLHVRGRYSRPAVAWPVVILPRRAPEIANPDAAEFVGEIPLSVVRLVRRYEFGQPLLLASLAALSTVEDLAESNANLLWLLALGVYEGRARPDEVGTLSLMKQADLLRKLVGSGSKAQVRFLRKVRPQDGTLGEARALCRAVQETGIVHALRHRTELPMRLVALLAAHPLLAREELLPIMEAKLAEATNPEIEDMRRLHHALRDLERIQPRGPRLVDALETAMRALDKPPRLVSAALNGWRSAKAKPKPPDELPPPPLRGTDTIVPITTASELAREGTLQRHCVGGYADAVRKRRVYVYRVLAPERATLEICLTGGEPRIGQLKLACNREPGAATVAAVDAWLHAAKANVAAPTDAKDAPKDS